MKGGRKENLTEERERESGGGDGDQISRVFPPNSARTDRGSVPFGDTRKRTVVPQQTNVETSFPRHTLIFFQSASNENGDLHMALVSNSGRLLASYRFPGGREHAYQALCFGSRLVVIMPYHSKSTVGDRIVYRRRTYIKKSRSFAVALSANPDTTLVDLHVHTRQAASSYRCVHAWTLDF